MKIVTQAFLPMIILGWEKPKLLWVFSREKEIKIDMGIYVIVGLAIGWLLICCWLKFVDIHQIMLYLKHTDIVWILIANVFFFFAYIVRAIRWRMLMIPIHRLSISETCNMYLAGLSVIYFLPFHIGEMIQPVLLKELKRIPISKSLGVVVVDRIMNLLPIVILVLSIPILFIRIDNIDIKKMIFVGILSIFVCLIVICGGLYLMIINKQKCVNIIRRMYYLPEMLINKITTCGELFIEGILVIGNNLYHLWWLVLLSFSAMILECAYIWCIFYALGFNISIQVILLGYLLIYFLSLLPAPPARIGTTQALWMLVFVLIFNLDKEVVSAAVTISYTFTTLLICIVGIISFGLLGIKPYRVIKLTTAEKKSHVPCAVHEEV